MTPCALYEYQTTEDIKLLQFKAHFDEKWLTCVHSMISRECGALGLDYKPRCIGDDYAIAAFVCDGLGANGYVTREADMVVLGKHVSASLMLVSLVIQPDTEKEADLCECDAEVHFTRIPQYGTIFFDNH